MKFNTSKSPCYTRNYLSACISALVLTCASQGVWSAQIEEVVVTAQKRAENVQDVPIAISAFQGDALQERGVSDVSTLSNVVPSVTLDAGTPFSGSTAVLGAFIRGIGSNDFAMNIDPGVGVYLDGVYLARSVGANLDLPDVERIEILKGPQGTLFGRNTIGGAVSIVTRNPGDELEVEGTLTLGEDGRQDIKGFVAGPLSDSVAASVAFSSKKRDGFLKRRVYRTDTPFVLDDIREFRMAGYDQPSEEGGQNEWTVRGKVLWDIADTVTATFSADYLKQDQQGMNSTLLHAFTESDLPAGLLQPLGVVADGYNACISSLPPMSPPPGLCNGRGTQVNSDLVLSGFQGANVDDDPNNDRLPWGNHFITGDKDSSYSTGPSFSKIEAYSASATIDWEVTDTITIKSITAYRDLDWAAAQDMDGSPLIIADNSFSTVQDQFSQEIQVSGVAFSDAVQYVVGAYYFEEDGTLIDYPVFGQGLLQIFGRNEISTENVAIFGQIDWRINDLVGITIGGRYTEEDKSIFMLQEEINGIIYKNVFGTDSNTPEADLLAIAQSVPELFGEVGDNPLLYGFLDEQKQTFENFSGKFGVQLYPADDLMVYTSWSEGYKTGGWTTRFTVPQSDPESPKFDEEEATTIELGVKTQIFDNSVQINAAIFTTDYENIQLNQQVGISPTIDNQGDAEIKGGEIEIQALFTDAFSLSANASYLDATFETILPNAFLAEDDFRAGVFSGSELPKTPEWQVNISPRYELLLGNGGTMVFLADYTWTDELWNDTERTLLLKRESTENLNLSISYEPSGQEWRLTVGGINVTDERSLTTGFSQPGTGILAGSYNRGSQWYASLNYSF
jgi:iron complex outermembrane receptor protein